MYFISTLLLQQWVPKDLLGKYLIKLQEAYHWFILFISVKRFEVVLALANTIFLLFGTMYTTKESLEHLLLEEHHGGGGGDHHGNRYVIEEVSMCITVY